MEKEIRVQAYFEEQRDKIQDYQKERYDKEVLKIQIEREE